MTVKNYVSASSAGTSIKQAIRGREGAMHANDAGGWIFNLGDDDRFKRFVLMGTTGGTYYVSGREHTAEALNFVRAYIKSNGPKAVRTIVEISDGGRAPKNDSAIVALALAAKEGNDETRRLAREAFPKVARTGTHWFQLAEAIQGFGGWGRGTRRAFANFYLGDPDQVAYQTVKYAQRNGWSHADILRKAHPVPQNKTQSHLFKYIVDGLDGIAELPEDEVPAIILHTEEIRQAKNARAAARLITDYNLPREVVPTEFLNDASVWDALLVKMPLTAMIRNLGKMSSVGLIEPLSDAVTTIVGRLHDEDYLRKSRIHPMNLLVALKTYRQGHGTRGDNQWRVEQRIVDALDEAMYLSVGNIPSTGKKFQVWIDCSGSMSWGNCGDTNIEPREAAAAMALFTVKAEPQTFVGGFTTAATELPITPRMRIDDVLRVVSSVTGGTDCSVPMSCSIHHKMDCDILVEYTDSETWRQGHHGHPAEALATYRRTVKNPNIKFVVVGMTATNGTIGDIDDARTLDVVGFDVTTPNLISEFAAA